MSARRLAPRKVDAAGWAGRGAVDDPDVAAWLRHLGDGAARRERERVLLHDELRRFASLGLGALRVPVAEGGAGWSLPQLLDFVREVAAADPNAAHALRNHFLFVEIVRTLPPGPIRARWLSQAARGALFGDANSEHEGPISKGGASRIEPVDGGYRLDGEKFYSTGCLYADWIFATAHDGEALLHWVMVAADAPGVTLVDDWDGFGQRLTGSGTTRFRDVFVPDADVLVRDLAANGPRIRQGAFAQLYLTTVAAGIVENVLSDGIALLRARPRNFPHGSADITRNDPLLLEQVGQLSAFSFAAKATVAAAAERLEEAGRVRRAGQDVAEASTQASMAAAQAKLAVDECAARAGHLLFELGGASAASSALALDRHGRNARTLASHNPRPLKARAIGDHLVNGADLPRSFF